MARLDDHVARRLASVSIFCSRHAKLVLVLAILLTGIFGYGLSRIDTNVDVADVLPRGNYNTVAAHNLTDRFKSTFTQQVTLQVHIDEAGAHWERDNRLLAYREDASSSVLELLNNPQAFSVKADRTNITDEVYVRAIEEMVAFIQARTDFDRSISISNIYRLINWTVAGGAGSATQGPAPPGAFALPGYLTPEDAARYKVVDLTVKAAVLDTVDAISSPKWDTAATLFMPDAQNPQETRFLGEQMLAARDEYVKAVAEGHTKFTVFGPDNPPLFTVDLPVANAHSSALVKEDSLRLLPIISALILVFLFVAFRNTKAVTVAFSSIVVGLVWSYGTMGFLGIALNTLNMTIVPLVMGIGIDYSIHMINEFAEHKSEGHSDAEAFRIAGTRSGVSMLIATATTVGGLAVLIVSPSLLIAQMGLVATVALSVLYVLAITFIPAALTAIGGSAGMGRSFSKSTFMSGMARTVSRNRWAVVVLVVAVSVFAYIGTANLSKEAFGDPGRNYLASDPLRQEHEQGLRYFYSSAEPDEKANILSFEGPGVLTPEAMRYYRTIEANLKQEPRVVQDTLRTVPFFIETWLTVKGGAPGAATQVGLDQLLTQGLLPAPVQPAADTFPKTEAAIKAEVEAMFHSPMEELSSIIINYPRNDMAAMTFSVRAASYDDAEAVWHQVWHAVEEANKTFGGHPPPGIRVAFIGNTATNYLFIAEELPWLAYMNIVDNIVLAVLVFAMTRSVKITFVTLVISTLTSLWWLAILPFLGIGLAITLTLPMAFIVAIGTDYAIHFMWNIRQTKDPRKVFESTGKAILFSTITTTVAFSVFVFLQNVAVRRTMIATTFSFLVIFVVTLLVVPVFFRVQAKGRPPYRDSHFVGRLLMGDEWARRKGYLPPKAAVDTPVPLRKDARAPGARARP